MVSSLLFVGLFVLRRWCRGCLRHPLRRPLSISRRRQTAMQNRTKTRSKPRNLDKAHTANLALLRAGYGVSHGTIQGVAFPRMIRPFDAPVRRAS